MGGDLILSGHTLDLFGTLEGVLTIFGTRYFKRSTFLFFSLKVQK